MITKKEALAEMKARRGYDTIILFHNGDSYDIYEQDASRVAELWGIETETIDGTITFRVPEHEQSKVTNRLLNEGIAVSVCEMLDMDGFFVTGINKIDDE